MGRRSLVCCLLLLGSHAVAGVCPAGATGVHHGARKDARQQILDLEQQWRTATLNADIPAMDALLSEDYVGISWMGQVTTKASQLERLRSRSLTITRMDLSDVKVKVVQSVAIVTSRAELEGSNEGQAIKGAFLYTRIYQKTPAGVWKITNFESTRVPPPGREPKAAKATQ